VVGFFLNRPFCVKNITLSQNNGNILSIDPKLSGVHRGQPPIPYPRRKRRTDKGKSDRRQQPTGV